VANAIGLACLRRSASFHSLLVSHVPAIVRRGDCGPDISTLETLFNPQVSPVPSRAHWTPRGYRWASE